MKTHPATAHDQAPLTPQQEIHRIRSVTEISAVNYVTHENSEPLSCRPWVGTERVTTDAPR